VAHHLLVSLFSVRKDDLIAGGSLSMQDKRVVPDPGLPPRPGEPIPGDVRKKGGGGPPAIPLGGPTDTPPEKPGTEKGPKTPIA